MAVRACCRRLFVCGLILVWAPPNPVRAQDTSLVVATAAGQNLTVGHAAGLAARRRAFENNPAADSAQRRAIVERWIEERVIAAEAGTVSLKNRHTALVRARRAVALRAANLFAADSVSRLIKIDSATVDTFYHNHITRYTAERDQKRARIITIWKEGHEPGNLDVRDSLYRGWYPEDVIDSLYTRLANGESFTTLASRYSEDVQTKGVGGDMGWMSAASMGSGDFSERVLSQPLGLISKPIESTKGWHIVQVTHERSAGPVPLDAQIANDIVNHLVEQQHKNIMRELGDSLVAVARIQFDERFTDLPTKDLRDDMTLLVVNGRDTVYGADFINEQYNWFDQETRELPSPQRRREILTTEYARLMAWLGFLRKLGYTERPEIVDEYERLLLAAREAIVHERLDAAVAEYVPDSTTITRYFQEHRRDYGSNSDALQFAWNSIRGKLISEHRERIRQSRRAELERKWKVVRYENRYEQIPLMTHREKKPDA